MISWLALVVAAVACGFSVAAYTRPAPPPQRNIEVNLRPYGVCVDTVKYGSDAEFEQAVIGVTTPELRGGVLVCKSGEFVRVSAE